MTSALNLQDSTGYFGTEILKRYLSLLDASGWIEIESVKDFWAWEGNSWVERDMPLLIADEWKDNVWLKRVHAHEY
jgi:hypothetical protein